MADSGNVIYSDNTPLLTLRGLISVHYMDGDVLDGEFTTQDAYNIFIKVGNEAVMIPRNQIRFIKGRQEQSIEVDTSQNKFDIAAEDIDTDEFILPDQEDEEDGTVVLFTSDVQANDDDDDDGTVILYTTEDDQDKEDDDNTLIVSTPPEKDTEASTVPLDSSSDELTSFFAEESKEEDEEDEPTLILKEPHEQKVSATLICTAGPHTGDELELKSGIITMGRSSDNVLVLSSDNEISRHHAIILQESGKFVLQDQNSLNGTFINDEPVSAPHYLKDGDMILLGLTTLRYQEN